MTSAIQAQQSIGSIASLPLEGRAGVGVLRFTHIHTNEPNPPQRRSTRMSIAPQS